MSKYNKIHIFLRACNINKINNNRPSWFNYEKVFKSLLDSINFSLVDLTICFDGYSDEYGSHFISKYAKNYPFETILINTKSFTGKSYENEGSSKSTAIISQIIKNKNLPNDKLIFILENDYLFLPIDWATIALDLFNNFSDGNMYLSLYEHLDTYIFTQKNVSNHWGMYADLKSRVFVSNYGRWRELPAITSSWIMTKELFERDFDLHSIGISDNTGCEQFRKRGSVCVGPLFGISTHCEKWFLAPFVNWEELSNSIKLLP